MGRPKKKIDAGIVQKLAGRFMSKREIALIVGCDESVIRDRFSAEYAFGRECGKKRLRDKQLQQALRGNTTMLIFLGKQYLGQSDRIAIEVPEEPFDPVAAYAENPELMEKALQLERDVADANKAVDTVGAGTDRIPGLAVPDSHSGNGNGDDGPPKQSNGESRSDPGAG